MDAFSDFVTLVVPKVGQENATWKFDVRVKERKLTAFRLSYEDDMAVVADCLSLQFCSESSDPSAYTLSPILFTGGHMQEPAFVQSILGKSSLTSARDIHTLLTFLDPSDEHNFENNTVTVDSFSYNIDEARVDVAVVVVAETFYDSGRSIFVPFDSYDEDDSEHSREPWQTSPRKRKATSRLPERRPKRSDESPAEKSPEKAAVDAHAKISERDDDISNRIPDVIPEEMPEEIPEEIPEGKPKRGRGRPRKERHMGNGDIPDDIPEDKLKRGRGRPRKKSYKSDDNIANAISEGKPKTGRGRPRKTRFNGDDNISKEISEGKPNRGRGRPSKERYEGDDNISIHIAGGKRKRARSKMFTVRGPWAVDVSLLADGVAGRACWMCS